MSEEKDIFAGENQTQSTDKGVVTEPTKDSLPDPVAKYVGEGKKYANLEAYYAAFDEAQNFIEVLKNENKREREERERLASELSTRETVEEALRGNTNKAESEETPSFDEATFERLIDSRMSAREEQRLAEANVEKVKTTMTSFFGDTEKAKAAYTKLAEEHGISLGFLNSMAAKSPEAVLKLAGVAQQRSEERSGFNGSVNSEAFGGNKKELPSVKVGLFSDSDTLVQAWKNTKEHIT